MSRTSPDSHEMVQRRQQVAELYLQGTPQLSIAQKLGISQATVCRDLRALHNQWRTSQIRDFDQVAAVELKKLDRLEYESWQAWERSKQPQESTTVSQDGSTKRAQKVVKQQPGDPRYLELIHKCIAARRALLGLDKPTRIAPTSPDGEKAYGAHLMHELLKLAEQTSAGPTIIDAEFIELQLARQSIAPDTAQAIGAEGELHERKEKEQ